jgi:hypothetical protein
MENLPAPTQPWESAGLPTLLGQLCRSVNPSDGAAGRRCPVRTAPRRPGSAVGLHRGHQRTGWLATMGLLPRQGRLRDGRRSAMSQLLRPLSDTPAGSCRSRRTTGRRHGPRLQGQGRSCQTPGSEAAPPLPAPPPAAISNCHRFQAQPVVQMVGHGFGGQPEVSVLVPVLLWFLPQEHAYPIEKAAQLVRGAVAQAVDRRGGTISPRPEFAAHGVQDARRVYSGACVST